MSDDLIPQPAFRWLDTRRWMAAVGAHGLSVPMVESGMVELQQLYLERGTHREHWVAVPHVMGVGCNTNQL